MEHFLFVKHINTCVCIASTRSCHFSSCSLKLGLLRADSGAYPRGGKLALEA